MCRFGLLRFLGGFQRRKREDDSTLLESPDSLEIEVLRVQVVQEGVAAVNLNPKQASVRGQYDPTSTENIVDRRWLGETIEEPLITGSELEAIILWKFKLPDSCYYKSTHRVGEVDSHVDSRVVRPIVLLFYHNRSPDTPATDLSPFQQGLKESRKIQHCGPGNVKRGQTPSWKSLRHLSKHSNSGTSTEQSRAAISYPSPLQPRSSGDSCDFVDPILLPGVAKPKQHAKVVSPSGPGENLVVDSPHRNIELRNADFCSDDPQMLASGPRGTCLNTAQYPETFDSPSSSQDSPQNSTTRARSRVLERLPSHSNEEPEAQEDAISPRSTCSKDPWPRPAGNLGAESYTVDIGDVSKDSSQNSNGGTHTSSPTSDTCKTPHNPSIVTVATSPSLLPIEEENSHRQTGRPIAEASASGHCHLEADGSPSIRRMSTSSSRSSMREFPDIYWTYDEAEKNYFHVSEEDDGTTRKAWYPKKFM
ncbi:hypothetical protein B0H67DRAFT_241640 [Lasiosphaeris hirsuta]|uniref:Uncharacterized protein n=1 Tax=Lasiosphaeris hirsuta TaxID=260670 RepID=A0AA40DU03_9PEZI|nr:hypothetical protein B0H67DRAFT_241640 [Lasiosphaeris hirsuta]